MSCSIGSGKFSTDASRWLLPGDAGAELTRLLFLSACGVENSIQKPMHNVANSAPETNVIVYSLGLILEKNSTNTTRQMLPAKRERVATAMESLPPWYS